LFKLPTESVLEQSFLHQPSLLYFWNQYQE